MAQRPCSPAAQSEWSRPAERPQRHRSRQSRPKWASAHATESPSERRSTEIRIFAPSVLDACVLLGQVYSVNSKKPWLVGRADFSDEYHEQRRLQQGSSLAQQEQQRMMHRKHGKLDFQSAPECFASESYIASFRPQVQTHFHFFVARFLTHPTIL